MFKMLSFLKWMRCVFFILSLQSQVQVLSSQHISRVPKPLVTSFTVLASPRSNNSKILTESLRARSEGLAEIIKPYCVLIIMRSDLFHLCLDLWQPERLFLHCRQILSHLSHQRCPLFCHPTRFHINTRYERHTLPSTYNPAVSYPVTPGNLFKLGKYFNSDWLFSTKSSVGTFCLKV